MHYKLKYTAGLREIIDIYDNTTIVSRHKPEDQIKSNKMLYLAKLFYGAETWTITKSLLSRIDAFKMWVYRIVLKISWTEKITNEEVYEKDGVTASCPLWTDCRLFCIYGPVG